MKKNKLLYLEGIRGVAATVVFLCHLRNAFSIDLDLKIYKFFLEQTHSVFISKIIHSLFNVLLDGNLAVFIFWLMSAYVISIRLFKENGTNYLVGAFSKRYFRLMIPATCSVMFAYVLMKLTLMNNIVLAEQFGHLYSNWLGGHYTFTPQFLGAAKSGVFDTFFNFNEKINYNSALWSMNPELYGSLFCFALFAIYGTNSKRYYVYFIIFLLTYLLRIAFLQTFIIGFFICDIDFSENKLKPYFNRFELTVLNKRYMSLPLLFILLVLGGQTDFHLSNVAISGFLVFVIMKSYHLRLFFELKPIVWLGKISFSLYLLHIPIICSLSCFLYLNLPFSHEIKILCTIIITFIVTILLATIFTKYIDDMAVRFSNKVGDFFKAKKAE